MGWMRSIWGAKRTGVETSWWLPAFRFRRFLSYFFVLFGWLSGVSNSPARFFSTFRTARGLGPTSTFSGAESESGYGLA